MKWGTGEWSRFMCDAGQPVLMWLVCELSKEFFLCAPGCNPAKTISASVGMLREGDLQCAQRLLRENQRYNERECSCYGMYDTISYPLSSGELQEKGDRAGAP